MMDFIRNHKLVIGTVVFLLIVVTVTIVSLLIRQPQLDSTSSDEAPTTSSTQNSESVITVDNWAETVHNLSDDERRQVESILYGTAMLNATDTLTNITSNIRTDSYKQTYDQATQIYRTEFLIDIPSVKQTYRVVNYYSGLPPEESKLLEYTTMIYCPTEAELVWGKFKCTDYHKLELGG